MDRITKQARSSLMSKIRSTGNRSTEQRMRMGLVRAGIKGWTMHPREIPGKPDFWFLKAKLAIFVDGCFWHGCQRTRCLRSPRQNRIYWKRKIRNNIERGKSVIRQLRLHGCSVMRVWEHELASIVGVEKAIARVASTTRSPIRRVPHHSVSRL